GRGPGWRAGHGNEHVYPRPGWQPAGVHRLRVADSRQRAVGSGQRDRLPPAPRCPSNRRERIMADTMRAGNVKVMALSDGGVSPPPAQFMPDVPAAAWEQYRAQHLDNEGNLRLNLGCFLLRSAGRTLLVDTGIGGRPAGNFPAGRLLDELRAAGAQLEEI